MSVSRTIPAISRFAPRLLLCRAQNLAIAGAELLAHVRIHHCPCCGWSGLCFRSFAVAEYIRNNVICPGCGSFERHRALALFYPKLFSTLPRRPQRVLHFAPEPALRSSIEPLCDSYERSAIAGGDVEHHLNLTDLDLPASSCDVILLNHVLDCMLDDMAAIREMYRVLRPFGLVVAVVSYQPGSFTREYPPASNTRYRVYGSDDLTQRFAPFSVSVLNVAADLAPEYHQKFGIPETVWGLVLRKRAEVTAA
jgi:SAM-dependent methyltransferase